MVTITSGGSLTTAVSLTLLAWGIRALRGAALRSILADTSNRFNLGGLNYLLSRLLSNRRGRGFASVAISPEAFRALVEEKPVPFIVFRVYREARERENRRVSISAVVASSRSGSKPSSSAGGEDDGSSQDDGQAEEETNGILTQARCLPEHSLKELLIRSITPRALRGGRAATQRTLGSLDGMDGAATQEASAAARGQKLSKSDLLVLLSDEDDKHIEQLTSYTCALGYRCVYVKGGVQSLGEWGAEGKDEGERAPSDVFLSPTVEGLSRDGIFSLMYFSKTTQLSRRGEEGVAAAGSTTRGGRGQGPGVAKGAAACHVLDVRRHDELSLFGAFEGARHLPAGHLPHGLHVSAEEWLRKFRFPKPGTRDVVVLICNTGLRSKWVAQLFRDLGHNRVYFGAGGTNSWHLDPTLCEYESYEFGSSEIPAPELFALEQVNFEKGQRELAKLGLLEYIMGTGEDPA